MTSLNPKQFLATSIQNGPNAPDVPERSLGDDEWYHGTRSWEEIKKSGGLEPKYGSGDYGQGLYLTKDRAWADDYAYGFGEPEERMQGRRLIVQADLTGANLGDADTDPYAEGVEGVANADRSLVVIRPEGKHRIKGVTEARGLDRLERAWMEEDEGW